MTEEATVLRIAGAPEDGTILDAGGDVDVPVVATGPTGVADLEPLAIVTHNGRTAYYARCSKTEVTRLAETLADGALDTSGADFVVDHDDDTARLPTPDTGPLAVGVRELLDGCGWVRPTDPDDHEAGGGFVDADEGMIRDTVDGLLGRGWGDGARDVAVVDHWDIAAEAEGDAAIIVNAHGTDADRLLAESDPFAVLEGATLTARVVDADRAVVYLSEADEAAVETIEAAVETYPDSELSFEVVVGPDSYKAAEPTMVIEAVEGNHRLEARLRPPGPEEAGLYGRPTLVHTARTLAHVAAAVREGEPINTRLVTVTGDVTDDVTVELSDDDTLSTALDAVTVSGRFRAACVGGRFGGLTESLDVSPTPDALATVDLGTEGVVEVLNAGRCPVSFVGKRTRWASEANCGRCVPCREGSTQLTELLRSIYDGSYDEAKMRELMRVMDSMSICAFGQDVPRPVRTAMDVFASDFEAHADGECPTGDCTEILEVTH